MLEILLGQVPEAIYFSLFLIFTKNIKEKRILFTIAMVAEYLLLTFFIKYDALFQLLYTFMTYLLLKILYKNSARITDIFMFVLSSVILIVISIVSYMIVFYTIGNFYVALLLNRIMLFGCLFIFRNKFNKIYNKFNSLWNRHNNPKAIRSLTLRNISIIIFNLMFFTINICIMFTFIIGRSV